MDVIGRGHDEDIASALLHPIQEASENALGHTSVLTSSGRKGLFQLIDPKDDRSHAFGCGHGSLEVPFALANELVVEVGRVQTE